MLINIYNIEVVSFVTKHRGKRDLDFNLKRKEQSRSFKIFYRDVFTWFPPKSIISDQQCF